MNPELDENGRYPVLRTSKTEERQLNTVRRNLVLRRDRYRCVFCGEGGRLEVDHIIPWSAGGSDEMDNLRTLCHQCNQDRSNFKVPADDARRLPNGFECVYCTRDLLGESTTPIYCVNCNKKAPGIPSDPTWHPDVKPPRDYGLDLEDVCEVETPQARIARQVARQRAAAPPEPMNDNATRKDDSMRDWKGTRVRSEALRVGCRYCHSAPGEPCTSKDTSKPLEAFPAHLSRIEDAKQESDT